ncbi:hypothetical protein KFL_017550010, partial [Klebsormidium nitens]
GVAAAGAVFAYFDEVYEVRGAETRRVGPVQKTRAALVPHVVEVDEAGRRALPPGWRYTEGGNRVFHAGALSFDGRHWRGEEEWEIQDRAEAHMALELQREWPQWGDTLRLMGQLQRQRPPPPPDQDETLPAVQAGRLGEEEPGSDGEYEPPLGEPWGDLPGAYMVGLPEANERRRPLREQLRKMERDWGQQWAGIGPERLPVLTQFGSRQITVLSLFAGIGAELEGLLRAGESISKFLYVQIDPVARKVMEHRGLSRANHQAKGLEDPRSALILEAWRVISHIAKRQQVPPGFIFEMVDAADHQSPAARWAFELMGRVSVLRRARTLGADRRGEKELQARYRDFQREWVNDKREAQDVLDTGRIVQVARANDVEVGRYHPMNVAGEPLRIFLTSEPAGGQLERQPAAGGGRGSQGCEKPKKSEGPGGPRAEIGEFLPTEGAGAEEEAVEIEGLRSLAHGGQEIGPEWPEAVPAAAVGPNPKEKGFREIFAWSIYDLSDTAIEGVEFEVEFTDDKPIFAPRRPFSQYEHELLKAYCEEREAAKLITRLKLPSGVKEPNCAPTVMPRKKDA